MIEKKYAFCKYLAFNDTAIKWQIYCSNVGYTKIPPGINYPPLPKNHPLQYRCTKGRILDEFQIVYITKGAGILKDKNKEYKISQGNIFVLFPKIWHWYCPDENMGWNEYWFGFKGQYPNLLLKNGFLSHTKPVFDIGLNDSILQIFIDSISLVEKKPPCYQLELGAYIILLIAKLLRISQRENQGTEDDMIMQKAKFLMEENIYNVINIDSLLSKLGIGYTNLKSIFKNYTGMSPYQYFLHLKINKAKELLQTEQFSIKEIAYKLAFDNQYYFSKLFKKKIGVPPSNWHILKKIL